MSAAHTPMAEPAGSLHDVGSGDALRSHLLASHNIFPSLHSLRMDTTPLTPRPLVSPAGAFPHGLIANRLPPAPPLSIPTAPTAAVQQQLPAGAGPSRVGPLSWDPAVLALLASGNAMQLPPFLAALTQQQPPPPQQPHSLPDAVPLTVSVPLGPYQPGMPSALHLLAANSAQQAAGASRADVKPEPAAGVRLQPAEQPRNTSPPQRPSMAPSPPAVPMLAAPKPSNRTSYLEKNRMAQVGQTLHVWPDRYPNAVCGSIEMFH